MKGLKNGVIVKKCQGMKGLKNGVIVKKCQGMKGLKNGVIVKKCFIWSKYERIEEWCNCKEMFHLVKV